MLRRGLQPSSTLWSSYDISTVRAHGVSFGFISFTVATPAETGYCQRGKTLQHFKQIPIESLATCLVFSGIEGISMKSVGVELAVESFRLIGGRPKSLSVCVTVACNVRMSIGLLKVKAANERFYGRLLEFSAMSILKAQQPHEYRHMAKDQV
ncbi:hypothetical protein I7I51_03285 [Histoplasma capsulatum]|uniref:Uncharacterized protein n=1 Tax=Ajellomyces capsulatus TaxID=5037 RepID=A0A8A1M8P7_AJECA|nr:hypothetical protein I7I51_03285 [Histoplasma capsulatum]